MSGGRSTRSEGLPVERRAPLISCRNTKLLSFGEAEEETGEVVGIKKKTMGRADRALSFGCDVLR